MIKLILTLTALLIATTTHASPLGVEVRERASAILDSIENPASAARAVEEMTALADAVAASATSTQLDALGIAEGYLEIVKLLATNPDANVGLFADQLVSAPTFTVELGLLIEPEDHQAGVARAARELLEQRGPLVERYSALASAICVVHDGPAEYTRRINENTVDAPSRLEIFDHFVTNARLLWIDPTKLSPALMIHVVNMTEEEDQNQWALARYRSNPKIGDRFFEIQYDYDHFSTGDPKRVTQHGNYRLQSIKQYGGVCADQAYFAEGVAKACSIPSAYVFARGADVSHAWIGYLEVRGTRAAWNFNSGRYEQYQKLRGTLRDPQTGKLVADARVGLSAGQFGSSTDDRWAALGAQHAVTRMHAGAWNPERDIILKAKGIGSAKRDGSIRDQLDLLKSGLTRCSYIPGAWELVATISEKDEMDFKDLDLWARAVETMCGKQYQDFSFDIVSALISSVDDLKEQVGMWEWAFNRYKGRPDLAAAARIAQGKLYTMLNDKDRAWRMYEDVSRRYINDGPMVLEALSQMALMLEVAGRRAEIIPYLEDAARRVQRPPSMGAAFATQSNYFQIHSSLAMELTQAGRRDESAAVLRLIGF